MGALDWLVFGFTFGLGAVIAKEIVDLIDDTFDMLLGGGEGGTWMATDSVGRDDGAELAIRVGRLWRGAHEIMDGLDGIDGMPDGVRMAVRDSLGNAIQDLVDAEGELSGYASWSRRSG